MQLPAIKTRLQPDAPFEIFEFKGARPGPTLVILGGVHGNEHCGPDAINRMMEDLRIDAGTCICVPAVNILALEKNVRFVDDNLNRVLGAPDLATHEGRLVDPLREVIARGNYLLDLHSYKSGGPAFAFGDEDARTLAFARALPASIVVTGWNDCYKRAFPNKPAPGMGTTEYARSIGIVAATFECGQHLDPVAAENGCSAIRAALIHAGLSDAVVTPGPTPRHVRMTQVFVKEKEGKHARQWKHTDAIAKGEVFATFDDGSEQLAPTDGVVILPHDGVSVGTEWGYLAVEL